MTGCSTTVYKLTKNTLECRATLGHFSQHMLNHSLSSLPPTELHHWLALSCTPGIGPIRFFQLLEMFPDINAIFETSATQLAALGLPAALVTALQKPDWATVEKSIRWAEQTHHHILIYNDPRYPLLLKHTSGAPAVLFIQGDVDLLQTHQLAMVGSRNPTPGGRDTARHFAQHLSAAGLTITSGLALGVDGASHRGALETQGKTIAVLGSGLDTIYPRSHKKLAEEIANQGALVSEYPLGTPPKAAHFPQRNRLVCGLSLGVLVVEATVRSGSLITARLAAEQGREVFAIPGSIHNPLARGCHFLIRQGAKLVETAQDIIEELGALAGVTTSVVNGAVIKSDQKKNVDKEYQLLLDHIGFEATSIDQLVERTGFSAQTVASMVLMLELQGLITSVPGGYSK